MRRAFSSVGSTAVSGLTNIFVQLLAAMVLSELDFAYFAIISTTIILLSGLGRSVVGQTDMLRGDNQVDSRPVNASFLVGILIFIIGALILLIGVSLNNQIIIISGIAGLAGLVFIIKDSLRFRAFRSGRAEVAFISDASVLGTVLIIMFLTRSQQHTYLTLTLVWTISMFVGSLLSIVALRTFPNNLLNGARWVTSNKDIVLPATGEYLLQSSLPYILNFFILGLGGPAALGGYRLVQLLFAVLANVATGINAATLPKMVDSRDPYFAKKKSMSEFAVLTVLSLLLFIGLMNIPVDVGERIFGETWMAMLSFLVVGALHGWVNAVAVPNYTLLRLLGYATFSFYVRVVSVLVILLLAGIATISESPLGVAWSLAGTATITYAVRFFVSTRAINKLIASNQKI